MKVGFSSGITIIDALVTIVVIAIFVIVFFNLYGDLSIYEINIRKRDAASDIAYSNLHKYTRASQINIGSSCSSKMDLTSSSKPPGLIIGDDQGSVSGFTPEDTSILGKDVQQTVRAYAPFGCSSAALNTMPLKIVSTVTYGENNMEVSHIAYVY